MPHVDLKVVDSYKRVSAMVTKLRHARTPEYLIVVARLRMLNHVRRRREREKTYRQSIVVPGLLRVELDNIARMVKAECPTVLDIKTPRRFPEIVSARRIFVRAARAGTQASYPELAMYLRRPGRHTSLIFMHKTATERESVIADVIAKRVARDRKLAIKARSKTTVAL